MAPRRQSLCAPRSRTTRCARSQEQASAALAALAGSHEALRWQAEVARRRCRAFGLTPDAGA